MYVTLFFFCFFKIIVFKQFHYNVPRCSFLCIYPSLDSKVNIFFCEWWWIYFTNFDRSLAIISSNILSSPFSLSSLCDSSYSVPLFAICPTNLTCSFFFQYGLFLLTCPWIHSFFLFWVQSTDKKRILHFCYHGFHFCFFYLGLFKNDFHASDKIHFLIYLCWLFFLLLFKHSSKLFESPCLTIPISVSFLDLLLLMSHVPFFFITVFFFNARNYE